MHRPGIAIQIVNYKTKAFLEPLIAALVNDVSGSEYVVEINILDNASGDNLDDIGRKWHNHNVHVYYSAVNGGYGSGHNLLSLKTNAKYLLFLNPDTYICEPKTIDQFIKTIEQTDAGAVGVRLLTPKDRRHRKLEGLSADQLKLGVWDHGRTWGLRYHVDSETSDVAWVCGAAFLIGHETFDAIGRFDEKFFLYFEETDLCYRLHQRSKRVIYNPHVQMIHYGNASATYFSTYFIKSLLYYTYKRLKGFFRSEPAAK